MSINNFIILVLINICIINSIRLDDNDFFTTEMKYLVRKINRLSISRDNKIFMNILVKRLHNLIKSRKYETEDAPREKYTDIGSRKDNIDIDDYGTYNIYTQETVSFDRGYQVSFETLFDDYESEEYDEIAYRMSLMSDNHVYIGVWATGIELSFHFDDFELANALSILYNQMAIWDWGTEEEIDNPYYSEYHD